MRFEGDCGRMIRLAKISGNAKKQLIFSVDEKNKAFSLEQDVNAQEIFELLQFEKGTKYQLAKGDSGAIADRTFDAFYDLIDGIIKQINSLVDEDPISVSKLSSDSILQAKES